MPILQNVNDSTANNDLYLLVSLLLTLNNSYITLISTHFLKPSVLFLYPMKTSENQNFWRFQRVYKWNIGLKWINFNLEDILAYYDDLIAWGCNKVNYILDASHNLTKITVRLVGLTQKKENAE